MFAETIAFCNLKAVCTQWKLCRMTLARQRSPTSMLPTTSSHEHQLSAISKHLKNKHPVDTISDQTSNLSIIKKCQDNVDCLILSLLRFLGPTTVLVIAFPTMEHTIHFAMFAASYNVTRYSMNCKQKPVPSAL